MIELLKDIVICCNNCGKVFVYNKKFLDVIPIPYDHGENGMGTEIEFQYNGCFNCDQCNNEIAFKISGFEYPEGAYDNDSYEIEGGSFVEKPQMIVVYSSEDFDEDVAKSVLPKIEQDILKIACDEEMIFRISPREFEEIIERVLQDEGFETLLTPQTRDGGRDIIATKYEMGKPIVFYVECKRYGPENIVGVNIVRLTKVFL